MRVVLPFLAILAMLGAGQVAAAPIGRITANSATSACIGSAGSPTCAAETLLACFARAETALCRKVGVADPGGEIASGPHTLEYAIDRQTTLRQQDITEDLRDLDYFKPGYVLLEIRRRDCAPTQASCDDAAWSDLQVYARPVGSAWEIVAWRGDNEQESAPEIPETYQRPPGQN